MGDDLAEPDWERLARYLSGNCSDDERALIDAWIDADPARRRLVDRLESSWQQALVPDPPYDVARAWEEVVRRHAERQAADPREAPRKTRRESPARFRSIAPLSTRRSWLATAGIAAALLLAAGSLARWGLPFTPAPSIASELAVLRAYTAQRGERLRVGLEDGTAVVLAPGSTLRLLADTTGSRARFGSVGTRAVTLEGEAFFDVVHDATRPFEVRTAHGTARDLGTSFVVASYAEQESMRVAVSSGIVALHRFPTGDSTHADTTGAAGGIGGADTSPLVTLTPGDVARLDRAGTITLSRGTDLAPYFAWTEGRLVFRGTPLAQAAATLSRWYDLDITVADSALAALRVTATFDNAPAEHMLRLLAIVLDVRAEQIGRLVTLRRKS